MPSLTTTYNVGAPGVLPVTGVRMEQLFPMLTEQQVQQLDAIHRELHQTYQPQMRAAMHTMQEAKRLLETERPDWDQYERTLREAADQAVQGLVAMGRAGFEARMVLTPEQRQQVETAMGMMREMMMGMHGMRAGAMGHHAAPIPPGQHRHPQ